MQALPETGLLQLLQFLVTWWTYRPLGPKGAAGAVASLLESQVWSPSEAWRLSKQKLTALKSRWHLVVGGCRMFHTWFTGSSTMNHVKQPWWGSRSPALLGKSVTLCYIWIHLSHSWAIQTSHIVIRFSIQQQKVLASMHGKKSACDLAES